MASVILSDFALRWAFVSSLIMFALALLLLLQIILLRLALIRNTVRERRVRSTCQPILAAVISGEAVVAPALAKGDEFYFMKLWNHLHASLRGAASDRLNSFATRCGIQPYVHGLLRRRDLHSRLLALETLGNLGDRTAWNDILKLTYVRDPLLSLVAMRTLLQIDTDSAVAETITQLIEREDWSAPQLAMLVEEFGTRKTFSLLVDAALGLAQSGDPASPPRLRRLLQMLEVAPPELVMPAMRRILRVTASDEVTAQCLKLLIDPIDLPEIRSYLSHASWMVRLQAARTLGRIGIQSDWMLLEQLLHDPVWWVRYRAGQALEKLVHGNEQILSLLQGSIDDRFTREMFDMIVAEGKLQ